MTNLKSVYNSWVKDSNRAERIWMMAVMDFKLRYYENKLGLLWALIKPLSQLAIYYVVFQVILDSKMDNFAIFLFLGLIIWNFFDESTSGLTQILANKRYLYEYSNMSKIEIYLSAMLSNTIGFAFNLAIYIIASLLVGIYPDWHSIYFPLVWATLVILSFGFALILSNLYLVARDISQIYGIVSNVLFFVSPILFKAETFRNSVPGLDYLNPISGIVINARKVFMFGESPDWVLMGWNFIYSLVFLLIGGILFNKLSPKASEIL